MNNDDDEKQIEQITKDIDSIQDLNVQSSDVMDGKKINSPEEQKNNSTQSTVNSKSFKPESHIEGEWEKMSSAYFWHLWLNFFR